jgi:tRNA A-37 threonylcarbamoyl transferase component Bud32
VRGVPELSPWVLPGYAEERPLGRGASGRVVATVDEASGQRVAIKYLAPRLFRDPEFLAGFRAEADLLRSLDVPHVVRLFDYVEEPGQGAAIVMELVDGVSLHELISRRGATSPEAALVVLKGSLFGLAAAHALGIVHRDYKPENVLVDAEGNSKLSDFGVAVKEGRRAPAAGTPLYMAPEQWEGTAASPATDIYAAAAVFFECLTSKTPFSGRLGQLKQQHASAAIPLEEVDEPLRGLIARGMAKNPADRPANAMAFVTELESTAAAAYGPAQGARRCPAAVAARRRRRRGRRRRGRGNLVRRAQERGPRGYRRGGRGPGDRGGCGCAVGPGHAQPEAVRGHGHRDAARSVIDVRHADDVHLQRQPHRDGRRPGVLPVDLLDW